MAQLPARFPRQDYARPGVAGASDAAEACADGRRYIFEDRPTADGRAAGARFATAPLQTRARSRWRPPPVDRAFGVRAELSASAASRGSARLLATPSSGWPGTARSLAATSLRSPFAAVCRPCRRAAAAARGCPEVDGRDRASRRSCRPGEQLPAAFAVAVMSIIDDYCFFSRFGSPKNFREPSRAFEFALGSGDEIAF